LFRELIYMGFRILQAGIADSDNSGIPPKDFLMNMSVKHWNFAVEHSVLYQLMFSLEKPAPNEEMSAAFDVIKSKFRQLSFTEEELHEVLFSWMCLMSGTISFLLFSKFPEDRKIHAHIGDKFTFFKKIIKRFIDTL
jgi:hypothetical protein